MCLYWCAWLWSSFHRYFYMSKHNSEVWHMRQKIYGLLSKYISSQLNKKILPILTNICSTYVSDTYVFSDLSPLSKVINWIRQQYLSFMIFVGPKGLIFQYLSHKLVCLIYASLNTHLFMGRAGSLTPLLNFIQTGTLFTKLRLKCTINFQ